MGGWELENHEHLGRFVATMITSLALLSCTSINGSDKPRHHEEIGRAHEALTGTATFRNEDGGYSGTVDGYISGYLPGNTQRATVLDEPQLPVWHKTDSEDYEAESFIRFSNLSLPAGAQVTSATLTLTCNTWDTGYTMTGYYLKNPWSPASAGWVLRDTGLNWSAPGAQGVGTDVYSGVSFSNSTWNGNGDEVRTFTLEPTIVQSWIDNPATNLGVLLTNNGTPNKYLRVYASEDGDVSRRPLLTINYSVGQTSCGTSTPAAIYNQSFASQSGRFTISADATPAAGSGDTGFGVDQSPPLGETDNWHTAITLRFNSATGQIDVRNGSAYVAPNPPVPFSYGATYHFRADIDLGTHTYAAYVTPPGQSEVPLGTGLAFRSNYASATFLNNARGTVDSGSVQICNVQLAGSCSPESDAAFCSRLAKNCGQVSGTDNCSNARTVSSCGTCVAPATCGGSGTANVCGSGVPSTGYDSGVTVHLQRVLANSTAWVSFGLPIPAGRLASASTVAVFRHGESTPISGVKVKALLREHGSTGSAQGVRAILVQIPASAITGSSADVDVAWSGGAAASDTVTFAQVSGASAEIAAVADRTITQNGSTCSLVETSSTNKTLFTATEPVFMATFPADYLAVTGILGAQTPRAQVVAASGLAGLRALTDNVTPFGLSAAYLETYKLNPAADSVVDPVTNYEGWLYDRCATFLEFYAHTADARFLREGYRQCSYYASKIDASGIFTGKPDPDIKYSHLRGLYAYYALTGDESAFTAGQNIANLWLNDPTFVVPYRQGHIRGPDKLWTERLLGTSLEGLYYGHRLLDDPQYLSAFEEVLDTAYRHITTTDQATLDQITALGGAGYPDFPAQNCFIHSALQHAEGDADQPWCSGWMTELTIDALLQYQKQTGDPRVDEIFVRLARALRDVGSVYFVNNVGYYDDKFLQPQVCYDASAGENVRQLVPSYGAALYSGGRFVEHDADEEHCPDAAGLMAVAIRALKRQGRYDQGGPIGPFASEGTSFLQMLHEFAFCASNRFSDWTRLKRDPANWTSAELCSGASNPAAFISNNKIGYPSHQIGPQRKLSWWFNQSLVEYAALTDAGVSIPTLQPGVVQPGSCQ